MQHDPITVSSHDKRYLVGRNALRLLRPTILSATATFTKNSQPLCDKTPIELRFAKHADVVYMLRRV